MNLIGGTGLAHCATPALCSTWNHSRVKRFLDLGLASAALLLVLPLMVLTALLVKLSSAGPVFFRQRRVGKDGREFELLKFRTMTYSPIALGSRVTRSGDPRIFRVGKLLRKWKLDEFPQLVNVLRGEMSLVGPRPDVAEYLATLNPQEREILRLRPGITSAASLRYRNEEKLLSAVPLEKLEQFYCTEILPDKVHIDLKYASNARLVTDLILLGKTFFAIGGWEETIV
jgi:lipopolysaccharide/colanic/teichoic acid biosynthesis glycosyltransferase